MHKRKLRKSHKRLNGFTIIELLIVLAIVMLILLIIFLAIPALQRNVRNNQRKRDAAYMVSNVMQYLADHNNHLPKSCNNTQNNCWVREFKLAYYDNKTFGVNNVSFWNRSGIGPFDINDIVNQLKPTDSFATTKLSLRTWARCSDTDFPLLSGEETTPRDIAVQFGLETGGEPIIICLDSRE